VLLPVGQRTEIKDPVGVAVVAISISYPSDWILHIPPLAGAWRDV